MESPPPRRVGLVLALFILIVFTTMLRHEMWRDEWHSWLLAKGQNSLGEVFTALHPERQGPAWFVILFFLSRVFSGPWIMQALHLVMATISAWLILRRAPFPFPARVLTVFGYFFIFEYGVISRQYALGVLCLLLFCDFYRRRPQKTFPLGIFLFILATTSVQGLMLAGSLTGALILDSVLGGGMKSLLRRAPTFLLAAAGALAYYLTIAGIFTDPNSLACMLRRTLNMGIISDLLGLVPRGLVPVPQPVFHFWNTNWMDVLPAAAVTGAVLGLLGFLFGAACVRRSRTALAFYLMGVTALLAVSFWGPLGFSRHQGHIFLVLLGSLWMAGGFPGRREGSDARPACHLDRALSAALTGILVLHAGSAAFAAGMDILHPFSQARATAEFLKSSGLDRHPLVGEMDYLMTPVSGYLGRRIYFPRGERLGSYVAWGMHRRKQVPRTLMYRRAEEYAWRKGKDVVVICGGTHMTMFEKPGVFELLFRSGRAIVSNESYVVYRLVYRGPAPQGGPESPPSP